MREYICSWSKHSEADQADLRVGMSRDHQGVDEFVLDVLFLLAIAVCSTCLLIPFLKLNIADIAPVFEPIAAAPIYLSNEVAFVWVVVMLFALTVLLVLLYKELALALAAWATRKVGNPMHILNSALLSLGICVLIPSTDDASFLQCCCLLLSSVWWNDGTKQLMAIPPLFGYCLVFILIPTYLEEAYAWPFCWLTLFRGFLRILDGSGTPTQTCLFVWPLSYTFGLEHLSRHQVSNSWDGIICNNLMILFSFGVFWFTYQMAKLAWNIYLEVFAPLTWRMKEFLVADLASMIMFTIYCSQISGPVAVLVGCASLWVGWLLTGGFIYYFHMRCQNQQELDRRLQTAGKIGVAMDVGGKIFTYVCVLNGVHNTCPQCIKFLEFFTTILEAMIKWEHARRAHAREVTPGTLAHLLLDV